MTDSSNSYIMGVFEHPTRKAPDKSVAQLHAECALGALADAGLSLRDVDGYFCAGDAPGRQPLPMADYLGLKLHWMDGTDSGGCSYISHLGHAAAAIASGKCSVALITMGGRPRSTGQQVGVQTRVLDPDRPEAAWDGPSRSVIATIYGMMAQRHRYEYGTTPEQIAAVKVAASFHAQYNPHAYLPQPVTIEDVVHSEMIADPLHKLDCCVITDGGGAAVLTSEAIARTLKRPLVKVLAAAETVNTNAGGHVDLMRIGAAVTGPSVFKQAGLKPGQIQYASIYDNFTIMVVMQLEQLGFCKIGQGGPFVAEGNLMAGRGSLPWNTDGGGLSNNHPSNRGGMVKIAEAVRQLRGEAHPAVQVPNCSLALVSGPGLVVGGGHSYASAILERN